MWSENIFWTLLTAVLIGAAILYGIVLLYAFPLLARFENTTFGILKTALLVGVRYLFCTLLMAAIYGIMGLRHRVCVHARIPAGHGLLRHALHLSAASDPLSDRWRP